MKNKNKKINYVEEPRDEWALPDEAEVLSKENEQKLGFLDPSQTKGIDWERQSLKSKVILRPKPGGARPGAGRKPKGHVRMQILVKPQTRERIRRMAKKRGTTISEVVAEAFSK